MLHHKVSNRAMEMRLSALFFTHPLMAFLLLFLAVPLGMLLTVGVVTAGLSIPLGLLWV